MVDGAGAMPLLMPSLAPPLPLRELLDALDGLLLTGAYSNIEPHHYGDGPSTTATCTIPARDATSLALVPLAIEMRVPVLAVCRGLQEVNVALGGTPAPEGARGRRTSTTTARTSRRRSTCSTGPRIRCSLIAAALAAHRRQRHAPWSIRCTGRASTRLGADCVVEATAPDGLVEAVRLDSRRQLPARGAMASGMEGARKSLLPRHIPGIRRRLPGARGATGLSMNGTHDANARPRQEPRRRRAEESSLLRWLKERRITEVECLVPDMTGNARGKIIPAAKFSHDYGTRLPEGIFVTTVTGDYPDDYYDLVAPSDSDMFLRPDPETVRMVPWASDPTAQIIHDCYTRDGKPHELAPRSVLRRVLALYEEIGLKPIVAPELEFFLVQKNTDPDFPLQPPAGPLRPAGNGAAVAIRSMRSTSSTRSST